MMDDIFAHWAGVKGTYINVMTHKSVLDLRSLGKEMNLGKSQSFTCSVIHLRNYDLCECGQPLGSDDITWTKAEPQPSRQNQPCIFAGGPTQP